MSTFEVVLQRKSGASWPVVVIYTEPGEELPVRTESEMQINLDALNACVLPKNYGTMLGKALFQGDLLSAYARSITSSREDNQSMRVLLTIEDAGLKQIHWERLCAPCDSNWDYVSLNQGTPFSIYLPSVTDRRFPLIGRRDLRALLVISGPEDLDTNLNVPPFDIPGTASAIKEALGQIPCDVLGSVDGSVGRPDLSTICQRLTEGRYTMLHMICHGQYNSRSGETLLYLPGDDRRPVTATMFLERLARLQGSFGLPQFAFLMTCESASPEAEVGFGGLGQRLVRDLGMPAVLAMTAPVSILTANTLAKFFYMHLREHGEIDLALSEALAGLMGHADVNVPAVFSRLGGRPLFSAALDRNLTAAEIEQGLSQLRALMPERAPILVPEFDVLDRKLRSLVQDDGLSPSARKERTMLLQEADALTNEILDFNFHALALDQPIPSFDQRCPFRGLDAFREEDRAFFFGREALVGVLVKRLADHSFLAVLGPSGSGKSSLVLAGLLPALHGSRKNEEHLPGYIYLTPGSSPLASLEAAISSCPAFSIVVVDQFEELFTLCQDENQRLLFIEKMLSLVEGSRVIITMRADFWGECAKYKNLKDAMQSKQELVGPLNTVELRRVIEQQAAMVGLRFEADLAETILDDVSSDPGAMPLLQHALLQLWHRRHGRWLRSTEYRNTGGVKEAIARTADDIYNRLTEAEQGRMRAIFIRLTHLEKTTIPGGAYRDARRRVTLNELVPVGSDRMATVDLVRRLANERLVVTGIDAARGEEEVEVAHEALIRYWPRLRGWLNEDRAALQCGQEVRDGALEWQKNGKDENFLVHRGGRLDDALELVKSRNHIFNQLETDYVNACSDLREKARAIVEQRRMRIIFATIIVAVAMTMLAIFGVTNWINAGHQLTIAQASGTKVAQSGTEVAYQAATADALRITAEVARSTAEAAQAYAEVARSSAEAARLEAVRQGEISLTRLLAAQSIKESAINPSRATLLAIESWLINQEPSASLALSKAIDHLPATFSHMRHDGRVNAMALSREGSQIITGSEDGTARLWDVATGKEFFQVKHEAKVHSVAISTDGNLAVSGSEDGVVIVWKTATGKVQFKKENKGSVLSVAFSTDGKQVVAGGSAGRAYIWDRNTGDEIHVLMHYGDIRSIVYSSDGSRIATTGGNTTRIWNVNTGEELLELKTGDGFMFQAVFNPDGKSVATAGGHKAMVWASDSGDKLSEITFDGDVYSIAYSPDGKAVVASSEDFTARVWEAETGKEISRMVHGAPVHAVSFSPDGEQIISGGEDNIARLWESATGKEIARMKHANSVTEVAFLPSGGRLASASADKTVRVWKATEGKKVMSGEHKAYVTSVAFSLDGKRLVSGSGDTTVGVWDSETGLRIKNINVFREVYSVAISSKNDWIATGSSENKAQVWNIPTGEIVASMSHDEPVTSVAFSLDGEQILSAGGNIARVWLITTNEETTILPHMDVVTSAVFNLDGTFIATGCKDGKARIWDATGKEIARFDAGSIVESVAFSPDGKWLATGSQDQTVRVWDITTGTVIHSLNHENSIPAVIFSPDGNFIASASGDNTVKIWEAATGNEVSLIVHKAGATDIAFSPDGKRIASSSVDGFVRIWEWATTDLIRLACSRLDQNMILTDMSLAEWQKYLGDRAYIPVCDDAR